jgi:hypothetical protein
MGRELTYSISGLSEETGIDRRTLKKRLRGLPAAEERDIGNGRVEKRWRLTDVRLYLELHAAGLDAEGTWESGGQMLKRFAGTELFPKLVAHPHYSGGLSGYAHGELGMSKPDALDFVSKVTLLVMSALSESFGDPDMEIRVEGPVGEWLEAKNEGRTDVYLTENWPDTKAKPKRHRKKENL